MLHRLSLPLGVLLATISPTDTVRGYKPPPGEGGCETFYISFDCDGNGIDDRCDRSCSNKYQNCLPCTNFMGCGQEPDCNGNGQIDSCEPDCNGTGQPDQCDITSGTSPDCQLNGVPDECDLSSGTSQDADGNGIPDECDFFSLDCNADGIADGYETTTGNQDCNGNAVCNSVEIAACLGTPECADCNSNGIPDGCEMTAATSTFSYLSGDLSPLVFGQSYPTHTFFAAPIATSTVTLEFTAVADLEAPDEFVDVYLNNTFLGSIFSVATNACVDPASSDNLNITASDFNSRVANDPNGNAVLRLEPSASVGNECSSHVAISVSYESAHDCGDGIPDVCGPDCNTTGIADDCDITAGTSLDCNANGIPDECDISDGTSLDCEPDGVPDECSTDPDCNGNNIPDTCDISSGTSIDCDSDGVPDECYTDVDCNANGVPDACETDCNGNGIPDECDISNGTSIDCDSDGVPDECYNGRRL